MGLGSEFAEYAGGWRTIQHFSLNQPNNYELPKLFLSFMNSESRLNFYFFKVDGAN
jgi:hypothetical protein